jgi:hypothetical protein
MVAASHIKYTFDSILEAAKQSAKKMQDILLLLGLSQISIFLLGKDDVSSTSTQDSALNFI